jgi:hypothetical protein
MVGKSSHITNLNKVEENGINKMNNFKFAQGFTPFLEVKEPNENGWPHAIEHLSSHNIFSGVREFPIDKINTYAQQYGTDKRGAQGARADTKLDNTHVVSLANHIKAFGYDWNNGGIVVEIVRGIPVIKDGHHRLAALKRLGVTHVSVYVVEDVGTGVSLPSHLANSRDGLSANFASAPANKDGLIESTVLHVCACIEAGVVFGPEDFPKEGITNYVVNEVLVKSSLSQDKISQILNKVSDWIKDGKPVTGGLTPLERTEAPRVKAGFFSEFGVNDLSDVYDFSYKTHGKKDIRGAVSFIYECFAEGITPNIFFYGNHRLSELEMLSDYAETEEEIYKQFSKMWKGFQSLTKSDRRCPTRAQFMKSVKHWKFVSSPIDATYPTIEHADNENWHIRLMGFNEAFTDVAQFNNYREDEAA